MANQITSRPDAALYRNTGMPPGCESAAARITEEEDEIWERLSPAEKLEIYADFVAQTKIHGRWMTHRACAMGM